MLLGAIASLFLVAQAPAADPKAAPDFKTESEELERGYDAAQDAYYAPLRTATSDEERSKVQLDPKLEPDHLFIEKFRDLARRAKGDDAGARALLWLVQNGAQTDPNAAKGALDELVQTYVASPRMSELAQTLRYGSYSVGRDKALEALDRIEKGSPLPNAKAAALYASGAVLLSEGGDVEQAKARFHRVQKEFGDTPWSARAESSLFEAEHLQIGMTAPDFDAIDENGKPWKSADLRGKVVVLDFWGFW